jgi:hypothetical protein
LSLLSSIFGPQKAKKSDPMAGAGAENVYTESKARDSIIEDVPPKLEQARVAREEEHRLSVWDALSQNKIVVFWCVFFAFSCIGWYVAS